jgi:hypothetical protein
VTSDLQLVLHPSEAPDLTKVRASSMSIVGGHARDDTRDALMLMDPSDDKLMLKEVVATPTWPLPGSVDVSTDNVAASCT